MQENLSELLSSFIREERKKKGLSQDKLAWSIGISKMAIQQIERKVRDPKLSTVIKICRGLRVNFSKLGKKIDELK